MRLVLMNGGLGNQAFQYIFMRWVEEKSGEACILDDMYFGPEFPQHNGYELEKIFAIHHSCLTQLLDADVIAEILRMSTKTEASSKKNRGVVSVLKEYGLDLFPVQEGNCYLDVSDHHGSIFSTPMNGFYPDILRCSGNLYYYGYWINARWFGGVLDTIVREFTFPPLPGKQNENYMSEIRAAGDRSVAVHIRRGDFVDVGWALPPQWYQGAFTAFRQKIERPIFFLFSDDMPWVNAHWAELGLLPADNIICVEGNMGGNNYVDMQLMSACRGMIISNSSFSYLAALLNRRPDKLVANPTQREII